MPDSCLRCVTVEVDDTAQAELWSDVVAVAESHGLHRIGVAPAEVMTRARTALVERAQAGLNDTMQFTYRNPERSTDPRRAVPDAASVIVAAVPYLLDEPAPPTDDHGNPVPAARVARYAWVDHYETLRAGLRAVAKVLHDRGYRAVAFADDNAMVDREAAWLGGLGWFGKNANLLLPGAGSWFVLGCVVTTARLPLSTPVADGCGPCRRCLDACPTGAIIAPGVVDARKCLAWLLQRPGIMAREYRVALGDRLYGCDDCQEVCPPTVRLGGGHLAPAVADGTEVQAWVPLLDLLDMADADIMERYGRWYIHRRDPRWLRRNALVVLGNIGDGTDERTIATLARFLEPHGDPMLLAHAVWTAARLGRRDLLATLVDAHVTDPDVTDPDVADELARLDDIVVAS